MHAEHRLLRTAGNCDFPCKCNSALLDQGVAVSETALSFVILDLGCTAVANEFQKNCLGRSPLPSVIAE